MPTATGMSSKASLLVWLLEQGLAGLLGALALLAKRGQQWELIPQRSDCSIHKEEYLTERPLCILHKIAIIIL